MSYEKRRIQRKGNAAVLTSHAICERMKQAVQRVAEETHFQVHLPTIINGYAVYGKAVNFLLLLLALP